MIKMLRGSGQGKGGKPAAVKNPFIVLEKIPSSVYPATFLNSGYFLKMVCL